VRRSVCRTASFSIWFGNSEGAAVLFVGFVSWLSYASAVLSFAGSSALGPWEHGEAENVSP
jgi:hypothetical protein